MAVKRRLNFFSGQRLDIPHVKALESAVSFDFDSLIRGFVTGISQPYILRGFHIRIPSSAINASSLQIDVSDSAVFHSTAAESGTILTVPAGTAAETLSSTNTKVIGAFQNNAINYVALDFRRETDTTTIDAVAGWSQSQQTEIQRQVPIARTLDYRFIISTSGFSTNLPLYIVKVGATGSVEYITQAKSSLFRLGSGGTIPNPYNNFLFNNLENSQDPSNPTREWINENPSIVSNPVSVIPGDDPNAFKYGDWAINSLKEWMDAIMTRFKQATGSDYWYTDSTLTGGNINMFDVWWDAAGSALTGSGNLSYNLIMEAGFPDSGAFQSKFTDSEILPKDSYIQGATSGNTATLQSFNFTQLLINSLKKETFVYDEVLYNRRLYRPNLLRWEINDYKDPTDTHAVMGRKSLISGPSSSILSWSYSGNLITINTATPHGLSVGDYVELSGMSTTTTVAADLSVNGIHLVKHINSTTQFVISSQIIPTGTTNAGGTAELDSNTIKHPYLPRFPITAWSYVGTAITITAPNHSLETGDTIVVSGLLSTTNAPNGRWTSITVNPDRTISYTASAVPTGSATVNSNSILRPDSYSFKLTVTGSIPDVYNKTEVDAIAYSDSQLSYILDTAALPAQGNAEGPIELDGVVAVSTVLNPLIVSKVLNLGISASPQYTLLVTTSAPHSYITPVGPSDYTIYGNNALSPYIRTYENVTIVPKGADEITSISRTNPSFDATVTLPNHNFLNGNTVEIFGFTEISFNGTFQIFNVTTNTFDITTLANTTVSEAGSPTKTATNLNQFRIEPTFPAPVSTVIIPPPTDYINSGSDDTFAAFPNNPYPGPIQWDSDLIVKGIIGDKYFRIPQTALASGTPLANKFNVTGQTGTAFLQNGEVAYIILQRNKLVSNGSEYTSSGGNLITGTTPPLDESGAYLKYGDFVKFEGESENKWVRITGGVIGTNVTTSSFNVISDSGQNPTLEQRPNVTGRLRYSSATYNTVTVKPHYQVDSDPNIYWLAVRRDNGSPKSKVYLKSLELEGGEVRQINDNEPSNLLIYTGAGNEAAVNPNYSVIDSSGPYRESETLLISNYAAAVDTATRAITFNSGPELGFQAEDKLMFDDGVTQHYYTINFLHSARTVVVKEDISDLSPNDTVTYFRSNYKLQDTDNLTLAHRKTDRENARINTALERPVYDESIYPQQINFTAPGTIKSGSYIYQGPQDNPTSLAWVLHGNSAQNELIESANITMPGGHPSIGANSILVHIITGTFLNGSQVYQNGALVSGTVNNPGDPIFTSPALVSTLEIVLPPNKRTQVIGSGYLIWPANLTYKASSNANLAGEELLVIANDTIRQANVDYTETFGGPKGKIQLIRDFPPNSRMRFRLMAAFGSALAASAGNVDLQGAYDAGNTIDTASGVPVDIRAGDALVGGAGLLVKGAVRIDGRGPLSTVVGGLLGPLDAGPTEVDQAFFIGKESNKPKEVWSGTSVIKKHTGYAGSGWYKSTASGTSAGAAPVVLNSTSITVPVNKVARICMTATARRTDGPLGAASFRIEGTFYNVGAGAVAGGFPATVHLGGAGDGNLYAVAFGVSGDDVRLVVFGTVGSTIQWVIGTDWQMLEDSV